MNIRRSGVMIAVNEAIVACRKAAHQHHLGADTSSDTKLALELHALGQQRTREADELARLVEERDDVPAAPQAERELIAEVISRAKAILSSDEERSLVEDSLSKEEALAAAVREVMAEDPEETLRERLHALDQQVARAIEQLSARTVQD
jgi:hypothetical protein